jgi:hypothetical protein
MTDIGFDFEVFAELGKQMSSHNKREHEKMELASKVYPYVLPGTQMTLIGGVGTLDRPDLFGPVHGYMWEVNRLTLAGYTSGTVTCTIDGGEPVPIPAAGSNYWSKSQLMIPSGSRLVFAASGIVGNVVVYGAGVMLPTDYYAHYVS